MAVRARFLAGDDGGRLLLGLRALGFHGAAGELVSSTLLSGHLLVSGLPDELLPVVQALLATGGETLPRLLTGPAPGVLLFSGRLEQHKRLAGLLLRRQELSGAAEAAGKMARACFHSGRAPIVELGGLAAGGPRTLVMGVLNLTPDSFSDGGSFLSPEAALAQAVALVEAGADLLDLGGESTRPAGALYGPGAAPVAQDEELRRVLPALRAIRAKLPAARLSVDTSRAAVAAEAIAAGAVLVNDVRALEEPALAELVARSGVACCLMHEPRAPLREGAGRYEDVVGEVADELCGLCQRAEERGVDLSRILVDPGFGFGKNAEENLLLLRELGTVRNGVGRPVLVGTSRKGFLGSATGRPLPDRERATAASCVAAILGGAAVVRVHDVAACRDAVALADRVARATPAGSLFAGGDES